jgi:hypothetical protein
MDDLKFNFKKSPTVYEFLQDNSFVRGLVGPVGSGKSYACAAEIFMRAVKQKPSPKDGIKYSRFVIVRNSYPELRTTTIKTWQEIFPENIWGGMRWSPPISHHIKLPAREGAAGIDCEVIFLALDQPKDVRKLLSLELTGAWVNEARELPKQVIDGLTHRVGRYPSKADGGPSWRGVWMDTNPMEDDHWWYDISKKGNLPKGKFAWKFYEQPGGVREVIQDELPEMPEANGYIFSAGSWWKENEKAENINNLPDGYYTQILAGKSKDWIRCYAEGKYTFVQDGKPVWSEYDDSSMCVERLEPEPGVPIVIGLDFGLTPAAVFAQRLGNGRWHVLHELVTFDMGLERFGQILKSEIEIKFPKFDLSIWGDPAGSSRDQIYEVTAFEHLKSLGIMAKPTATNDFKTRREAVAAPMTRLIQGKPGFLIDSRCSRTRKSLAGGYHYKRVQISGQERFKDQPNKNQHSHVGDALGYCLLGGGEFKRLTRPNQTGFVRAALAKLDFDLW